MAISSLEKALTHHIRIFLISNFTVSKLKKAAFIISLFTCLFAGSVLIISLFTPYFTKNLGYSQITINLIGSFIALGMYAPLPLLGYLADLHGPVLLAVISMILFCPGYYVAAFTFQNNLSYWYMCFSYAMIGCATSALYFSSLLSCAKIYPDYKGLSISAPVTCYGLSSLILSQLTKLDIFQKKIPNTKDDYELDIYKLFTFFSILYFALSAFNWVSSAIVSIERDIIFSNQTTSQLSTTEQTPLLTDDLDPVPDENLVIDHKLKFKNFLKDKSMYLLLASLFLCIGPLEMFITNMGSLISVIGVETQVDISTQVSVHATASTLTRLIMGGLSDLLSNLNKYPICRVYLLAFILICGIVGSILISLNYNNFTIISALFGTSYGGVFTLYPTILANIWGVEIFGSTWGLFMLSPSLGSIFYGLLYGFRFDRYCQLHIGSDKAYNCLSATFLLISGGMFLSMVIVFICWKLIWVKRGFIVF
ncbi:hypothetical protein PACTADRAFT_51501 [Pachysolen tannophilus NRRL Y-2460]|uniref:Probable transporter MCH1 n=1 Tax=Pachysolen tannophilus NRRL Y-2460 TaxID=669874 RepID=A0A1E4TPZ8_PACTA|nr:hypothetical protein PACTADRAFT_51501 [Pachysolen tannophilus NRRL Y-2460]